MSRSTHPAAWPETDRRLPKPPANPLSSVADEAFHTLHTIGSRAVSLVDPSMRLGVTGLSRAGKTVFITALVHALTTGARLPLLMAQRDGRLRGAALAHQPDDTVPRFQYEEHLARILRERQWPDSTRALSELRVTLHFASAGAWGRTFGPGRFSIDIVDYPGEWLLDLPLLAQRYRAFSADSFALASEPGRSAIAAEWNEASRRIDPSAPFNDEEAARLAAVFTAYLRAGKADENALSALPPGRFLMPGEMAGSPALTFVPLPGLDGVEGRFAPGSFAAVFERRFESYKAKVVRPFFRDHVARLDRQIVLVDAMNAINSGPAALADLERALAGILSCFRPGLPGPLAALFLRRIDRILIAATKADHIHHTSHDAMAAIVRRVVDGAIRRAEMSNARIDVVALAALRATREGSARHGRDDLPVIIGTPQAGETISGVTFDGERETAIFPGDLPTDPNELFEHPIDTKAEALLRFVRFRPPQISPEPGAVHVELPFIRLDKALEFLIGDKLA
jgi:uncharacterized protein